MRNISALVSGFVLSAVMTVAFFTTGSAGAQTTAEAVTETGAAALLEKHSTLAPRLAQNPYRRPLVLESTETPSMVKGHAYAVLDAPFNTVSSTFKSPPQWCEVLILHLNTKYCRAGADSSPATLMVSVGKKNPQPLKDAFALEFDYRVVAATPAYLATQLNADKGPLGTSNYRIELEAVPLPGGKTFMHLGYSYGYGAAGRLAMLAYLNTIGSGKIGFTQVPGQAGQDPAYVGGLRGAIERNTMRYYLAIDAYMASLSQAPAQQFNTRLQLWFDATEAYPQQLHELDKNSYITMKKAEYQRQQGTTPG